MYLPPLQPVASSDIRICGDVEIHPSASIASGVILQAAPESKIIIGVDACIGMGVIITASGGVVEISNGVTLGSGVLIVGQSHIGHNACIGTASTVFNSSVEPMSVINPGSIIGDASRQEDNEQSPPLEDKTVDKAIAQHRTSIKSTSKDRTKEKVETELQHEEREEVSKSNTKISYSQSFYYKNQNSNKEQAEASKTTSKTPGDRVAKNSVSDYSNDPWQEEKASVLEVDKPPDLTAVEVIEKENIVREKAIGKVYIDQLLVTLFPHEKHFNNNSGS